MARLVTQIIANGVNPLDAENKPQLNEDGTTLIRPCMLEDIRSELERQIKLLEPKHREAMNTVIAMDGQIAGFRCSSSWAEHYARGGKLQ